MDKVFQCFDSKRTDTIDFEEFVLALSVFHPRAGLEEKARCEPPTKFQAPLLASVGSTAATLPAGSPASCREQDDAALLPLTARVQPAAVAFRVYDLDDTGYIEPDEVKRFLADLLRENPSIILDDSEIDDIVEKASVPTILHCLLIHMLEVDAVTHSLL